MIISDVGQFWAWMPGKLWWCQQKNTEWVQLWGDSDFSLGCVEIMVCEGPKAGGILLAFQDASLQCERQVRAKQRFMCSWNRDILKLWLMRSQRRKWKEENLKYFCCFSYLLLHKKRKPKFKGLKQLQLITSYDLWVNWAVLLELLLWLLVSQLGMRPSWASAGFSSVPGATRALPLRFCCILLVKASHRPAQVQGKEK